MKLYKKNEKPVKKNNNNYKTKYRIKYRLPWGQSPVNTDTLITEECFTEL